MVLRLKTRESRSLPGLQNATQSSRKQSKARNQYGTPSRPTHLFAGRPLHETNCKGNVLARRDEPQRVHRTSFCQRQKPRYFAQRQKPDGAGWSSPVARQAHNLKAAGSNPAPATRFTEPRSKKMLRVFAFICGAGDIRPHRYRAFKPAGGKTAGSLRRRTSPSGSPVRCPAPRGW